jgi:hypothetical protein
MRACRAFLGTNDMLAYLTMMAPHRVELWRVLKPTGSNYLHCDFRRVARQPRVRKRRQPACPGASLLERASYGLLVVAGEWWVGLAVRSQDPTWRR